MIGLLAVGFVANELIRPVHARHHVPAPRRPPMTTPSSPSSPPDRRPLIAFSWLWVGAPLCYGLYELVLKVKQLFTG